MHKFRFRNGNLLAAVVFVTMFVLFALALPGKAFSKSNRIQTDVRQLVANGSKFFESQSGFRFIRFGMDEGTNDTSASSSAKNNASDTSAVQSDEAEADNSESEQGEDQTDEQFERFREDDGDEGTSSDEQT